MELTFLLNLKTLGHERVNTLPQLFVSLLKSMKKKE